MPVWVSTVNWNTEWSYYKNIWRTPWFDIGFHRADYWFDQTDPTWQGRPA